MLTFHSFYHSFIFSNNQVVCNALKIFDNKLILCSGYPADLLLPGKKGEQQLDRYAATGGAVEPREFGCHDEVAGWYFIS